MEEIELEGGLSDRTSSREGTLNESQPGSDSEADIPISTSCFVTVVRHRGRYKLKGQYELKNNLLAGVGYLELGNAGDFAANVWNTVPVKPFVMALMAIGATLALAISQFAIRDALLSWHNFALLRQERRFLQTQKSKHAQDSQILHSVETLLQVNFRETGIELIDRVGMDIMMGFGAVMVGIGTFMAIGGANPGVYHASNLLSGYIGNAPVAVFGIFNAVWSTYLWNRAHRQRIAGAKQLKSNGVESMLNRRTHRVKSHAQISGILYVVGGAASLVTATMWWGYIILAPGIVLSAYCNYFWRRNIGYDRPLVRTTPEWDLESLIEELKFTKSAQQILSKAGSELLLELNLATETSPSILNFLAQYDLFPDFCILLLEDSSLSRDLFGTLGEEVTIVLESLSKAEKQFAPRFLKIAQSTISKVGLKRFQSRERYLLEILGCYACNIPADNANLEKRQSEPSE